MTLASSFESAGLRVRLVPEGEASLGIIRLADAVRVGEVALSAGTNDVTVDRLCIENEYRSYGAGSEAAWLLVEAARFAGVRRLRAWAHPNLGLSVYFWTRMGFRPRHGEGPQGGIWFERTV